MKYILQEDEALEGVGGDAGSRSGCGTTLTGDLTRVRHLSLRFLVYKLQEDGKVVLR